MTHATPAVSGVAPGLSLRLREATAEHHVRAEKHPVQQALVRGAAAPANYAAWLRAMRALHEAFEARLAEARRIPALAAAIEDHHFRVALIDEDLRTLAALPGGVGSAATPAGAASSSGMGPRTREAWRAIESMIDADPAVVLGPFYVLEGSTNGGRFIAMAIRKSMPLPPGAGTKYLDPHGERIRERWAAAKSAMDGLALSPAQHDAIIDAAQRTFDLVTVLMDELDAA